MSLVSHSLPQSDSFSSETSAVVCHVVLAKTATDDITLRIYIFLFRFIPF